jgi:tetratricopeptide (TPR) repeat protein
MGNRIQFCFEVLTQERGKTLFAVRLIAIWACLFITAPYSHLASAQEIGPVSDSGQTSNYLDKGTMYFQKGEYQAAVALFQKEIGLNPQNALAYSLLGSTYFLLGKDKEGEESFQKAIELYNSAGDPQKAEKLISLLKNYKVSKVQTISQEAKINLKIIQLTEKTLRLDKKSYMGCDSAQDCNSKLNMNLSADRWQYYVYIDEKSGFCSEAKEVNGTTSWFITEYGDAMRGSCR